MKLGFLGAGAMGGAILSGAVAKGVVKPEDVYVFDVSEEIKATVKRWRSSVKIANPLLRTSKCFKDSLITHS